MSITELTPTMGDLHEVLAKVVADRGPDHRSLPLMFDSEGHGVCIVGCILQEWGINLRRYKFHSLNPTRLAAQGLKLDAEVSLALTRLMTWNDMCLRWENVLAHFRGCYHYEVALSTRLKQEQLAQVSMTVAQTNAAFAGLSKEANENLASAIASINATLANIHASQMLASV